MVLFIWRRRSGAIHVHNIFDDEKLICSQLETSQYTIIYSKA